MRILLLGTLAIYSLVGLVVLSFYFLALVANAFSAKDPYFWLFCLLALVLAGGVAAVEIMSRYRDEPFEIIQRSRWSRFYLVVNAILGVLAFLVLLTSGAVTKESAGTYWTAALTAGLGAATIVRARVFSAKVGGQEVAIGPGFVIDQLLSVLDREIDRKQAEERVRKVRSVMGEVSFALVVSHVVNMISNSRQNLSSEETKELAGRIGEITNDTELDDSEKSLALGFLILDMMGPSFMDVLFDKAFMDSHRTAVAQSLQQEQHLEDQTVANAVLVHSHVGGISLQELINRLKSHGLDNQFASQIATQEQRLQAKQASDQDCTKALGFAVINSIGADEFIRVMS